jgi:hypothetical protein
VDGTVQALQLTSVPTETWAHVHLQASSSSADDHVASLSLTVMAAADGACGWLRLA